MKIKADMTTKSTAHYSQSVVYDLLQITQNQQHKEKLFHKEGKKGVYPSFDTIKRRMTHRDELSEFELVGVLLTYRGSGDSNYARAIWVPKTHQIKKKSTKNSVLANQSEIV